MPSRRPLVLFDWGDTLMVIPGMLNTPQAHLECTRRAFAEPLAAKLAVHGRPVNADQVVNAYAAASREQIEKSQATAREHAFEDRFARTLEMIDRAGIVNGEELTEFAHALAAQVVDQAVLVEGAVEAVHRLAQRFRLGIVSNYPMASVVRRSLARFNLEDAFECIAVSGSSGWLKPHPNAFRAALDGFDLDGVTPVFIGDDLDNDVKGGKRMGMRTIWYAPGRPTPDEPDLDFHAHSHGEIAAWCERNLH
jgi:putative hydrolase of the HAD superfamily